MKEINKHAPEEDLGEVNSLRRNQVRTLASIPAVMELPARPSAVWFSFKTKTIWDASPKGWKNRQKENGQKTIYVDGRPIYGRGKVENVPTGKADGNL